MKTIKMRGIAAAVTGALLIGFGANAMADSTDDILNALIAKGVLTEEEGALLTKGRNGEKEAAAKKKDSAITASFKDGIKWESGDKANSMSVNGRIQMDYRSFGDNNNDTSVPDTFDVRRAYLGAKGVFNKYYEFEVATDFGTADSTSKSKSAQLDVAFINLHYWDQAQFKFGQFKMPFSLEEQTSSRFIDFQERSMVNAYAPAKEIGAMVWGEPVKGLNYGLALSTGEGKGMNETAGATTNSKRDGVDVIGRVTANLAEFMGNKDNVYHIGAAYSEGSLNTAKPSNSTEGKGEKFFEYDYGTAANTKVDRTRYGAEAAVALGPVKLQSEWVRTNYDGTKAGVKFDDDIDVWYAEALWLVTGEKYADSYKGGKFDRIKPKNDFNPDGAGMGAWEIGVRYSKLDASDLLKSNAGALDLTKYTAEANATTLGLKWIPMANWRFMANYVKTNYDTDITLNGKKFSSEDAFTVREQMDF
jgi:phosphate-selective porin OprO/OprP